MRGDRAITELKGIGPAVAAKFAVLGIRTVADLIDYYPRRYEDYSVVTPISEVKPGAVSIKAAISQIKGRYVRRGMHITEAVASDASGSLRIVWFNQPYRQTALKADQEYYISGTFELSSQRLSIINPSVELVSDMPVNTARIVPVYRETKGLTSRQIRAALDQVRLDVAALDETLPSWLVEQHTFYTRAEALRAMHFPTSNADLDAARLRLGFEEVFQLTLAALSNKYELMTEQAPVVSFEEAVAKAFVRHLPFELTAAQRKVVWQIYQDMQKRHPMNRLVEGDVGSGKTVVAAMAAVMVLHHGHQVALMAPTELLARQHADTLQRLLEPLGYGNQVGLLVGGMTAAQKKAAHEHIARGDIRFMVGTQALIQEKVDMHSLELIVIDEQHRFGVEQRKTLQAKAGHMPHVLSLTATPIPRSLALTLYGELDVSVLADKPPGRAEIETRIVSPNSRAQLYADVDAELTAGRQMFVVCPLIAPQQESSLAGGPAKPENSEMTATSAEEMYVTLQKKYFKHRRVGLLHGKMKPAEKNDIMQQFVNHDLDILVSTTVIEVGVDVPNASIMLIEGAERFGLAQIHQLRGRVGRGKHQGYCYLVMSDSKAPSKRLRALESSTDGFRLAELDLELRGPGAIYGTMQHGQLDLRIAKLTDTKLIADARAAAQAFIDRQENLLQYPYLQTRVTYLRAVTSLN
ncbi:MAG TPA: ATP-dependent DNA helicase RecG [Candidatus Saccharimonadales bacterium]|nr:ATP-dependent DNA helicase RecG [Candidatus Saccharimonadales bacterium]